MCVAVDIEKCGGRAIGTDEVAIKILNIGHVNLPEGQS